MAKDLDLGSKMEGVSSPGVRVGKLKDTSAGRVMSFKGPRTNIRRAASARAIPLPSSKAWAINHGRNQRQRQMVKGGSKNPGIQSESRARPLFSGKATIKKPNGRK